MPQLHWPRLRGKWGADDSVARPSCSIARPTANSPATLRDRPSGSTTPKTGVLKRKATEAVNPKLMRSTMTYWTMTYFHARNRNTSIHDPTKGNAMALQRDIWAVSTPSFATAAPAPRPVRWVGAVE